MIVKAFAELSPHFIVMGTISRSVRAAVNSVVEEYKSLGICWWMGTAPALSPSLSILDQTVVELCVESSAGNLKFSVGKLGPFSTSLPFQSPALEILNPLIPFQFLDYQRLLLKLKVHILLAFKLID